MTSALHPRAQTILDFWLGEGWESAAANDGRPEKMKVWFQGGPDVDVLIRDTFGNDCQALLRGEYDAWQQGGNVHESVAGIILGDQFFRNVYRDTAQMYAADPKVLPWAKALVAAGKHKELKFFERVWVQLPFMHSENLADQEQCVQLYEDLVAEMQAMADAEGPTKLATLSLDYAKAHRDVVAKWGRFPHRNSIVGRESTPEELEGLKEGTIAKF